ncbi:MAG: SMP-30/gluconolactonase/LRE family protein [Desulfobacterales bacterium]|nr:SMP-30/gluconolactonase/LRE family protein [Desulfobacterales bacterium]
MPVPMAPVAWQAPADAGYVGPFAVNTRLAELHRITIGTEAGPEHVALGPDGQLYAAVDGGKILRLAPDGASVEIWARTGGRVLGFDFDRTGRLIAADALRGLLAIGPLAGKESGRTISVLADSVAIDGVQDPIRYADAVAVASDNKIYFTDASRRFGPAQWGGTYTASILDIMEHSRTGRVLVHDPAAGRTEVLAAGLSFANGIALSADQQWLFVAETGAYRIWRIPVAARNMDLTRSPGEAKVIVDNLPGYPDNLMRGRDGRIWAGLVKPRSRLLDWLADKPLLRKMAMRLPQRLWPVPKSYGHVFAFDESGRIVADMQDPSGAYPQTTGVTETAERLYIQSLHAPALGWRTNDLNLN